MLVQRQEAEQELNQRMQKLQIEKQAATECASSLQRTLSALEAEKRDAERSALRLQKDKSALKKTLDKVSSLSSFWRRNDFFYLFRQSQFYLAVMKETRMNQFPII